MARARNIKPGFFKNEDLAECSIWARFIFPGLWMLADREGRMEDRPKRIKGELLPFDSQDVEPLLRELTTRGFIIRYENEDGRFIQIAKFSTHQTPHYSEKKSVIKPPFSEKSEPSKPPEGKKPPPLKTGPQPPDSLNPDSLNPEGGATRADEPGIADPPGTLAEWANFLTRAGFENPKVHDVAMRAAMNGWVAAGVTIEQAQEAIDAAIAKLGGLPSSPKYLIPMIEEVRAPRAPTIPNSPRSKRDDERRATVDGLTGRTREERDITADSAALG